MNEEDKELKEKIIKDVKQCITGGQDKEKCLDEAMKKHNLSYMERSIIRKEMDERESEGNSIPEEAVEKEY